jgi:hypothetical protein
VTASEPQGHAAAREAPAFPVLSAEVTARVPQLLEAMRSVGTGLEPHGTLDRICRTAAGPADARYAAIGVLDAQGQGLSDFVTCGVDEEVARRIGHRPDGRRGLLGALVREPSPVRLTDLTTDSRATGFPPATRRCVPSSGYPSVSRARSSEICI